MSEVLNRIEKFRQEIKYKYRSYLEKKEISLMAKQLRILTMAFISSLSTTFMSFILSLLIIKYCFLDGIKKPSKLTKSTLLVTELFLDEDGDEAGNMSEVLNRIEKFRQEIKYKYRS